MRHLLVLALLLTTSACLGSYDEENNTTPPKGNNQADMPQDTSGDMPLQDMDRADIPAPADMDTDADDMPMAQVTTVVLGSPTEGSAIQPGEPLSVSGHVDWLEGGQATATVQLIGDNFALETIELELIEGRNAISLNNITLPTQWQRGPHLLRLQIRVDDAIWRSEALRVQLTAGEATLVELKERSTVKPHIRAGSGGLPDSIRMKVPVQGADAVERAWSFLEEFGGLWNISHPRKQLKIGRVKSFQDGEDIVLFEQRQFGLFVEGSTIMLQLQQSDVLRAYADVTTNFPVQGDPDSTRFEAKDHIKIGFNEAFNVARLELGRGIRTVGDPRLVWYDELIFAGVKRKLAAQAGAEPLNPTRLAWKFRVRGQDPEHNIPGSWMILVDANTGELIEALSDLQSCSDSDRDMETFDANNEESSLCFVGDYYKVDSDCTEGGCDGGANQQVKDLHSQADYTYRWYYDNLCRRSYDGSDSQLETFARYGGSDYVNAAWSNGCEFAIFGPGYLALDVTAHEITHGVTADENSLKYKDESGAVNEHLSDAFGALVEGTADRMMSRTDLGFDPQHGEDKANGTSPNRDLALGTYFNSNGGSTVRDDYDDLYTGDQDKGGVHWNSSILNKAFALLAQGGTHNNITVEALSLLKLTRLWYDVSRKDLTKSNGFFAFRDKTVERVITYIDNEQYNFNNNDLCQVQNAFAAIKLREEAYDQDCDTLFNLVDADDDGDGTPEDGDFSGTPGDNPCTGGNDINCDDNCPNLPNNQHDSDSDGIGTACDDDWDNDMVPNSDDNCPGDANPNQIDTDGNGIGNRCDDRDDDWVSDPDDNCPDDYNPEQTNTDNDNRGDVCDNDDDNDGVNDTADNCPLEPNAMQTNSDTDNHGDACDNCRLTNNNPQANADYDQYGDACDPDDDNDGVRDDGDGSGTIGDKVCANGATLNCDDNCRTTHNPDQIDGDDNGMGTACDPGEMHALLVAKFIDAIQKTAYIPAGFGGLYEPRVPLPLCIDDGCPGGLQEITFTLSANGFREWAIVDNFGTIIANGRNANRGTPANGFRLGNEVIFQPSGSLAAVGPNARPDGVYAAGTTYYLQLHFDVQRSDLAIRSTYGVQYTTAENPLLD